MAVTYYTDSLLTFTTGSSTSLVTYELKQINGDPDNYQLTKTTTGATTPATTTYPIKIDINIPDWQDPSYDSDNDPVPPFEEKPLANDRAALLYLAIDTILSNTEGITITQRKGVDVDDD